MSSDSKKLKVVVVGGGPVGALAALYAGMRGHDVEVYELRNDLRDPNTIPLNFTKSINLALSERGINAMRNSGRSDLIQKVLDQTIPMRGRMVHGRSITGELTEQPQDYDAHGRAIFAADRGALNKILLDELEALPNVKFFFLHKLINADLRSKKAWFEIHQDDASEPKWTPQTKYPLVEVSFDLLIGADGAHSAARNHLMKYERLDYQQEYIDTLWVELIIEPNQAATQSSPDSKWVMSPHHLHIWPGKDFMFIAIAGTDGSFSCTLFAPAAHFQPLESDPSTVPKFFDTHFPGVTSLIPPESLINSFNTNPHLPLISIKMSPYHHKSAAVLLGDAAHAMVPFYGQGMNAGLEDVYTLFTAIDTHESLGEALAAYSELRKPDAHAINDLALQNYTEMRSSVTSRTYKIRKYLEETLSTWVPSLGWETKYARVSFGNERYSEVVRKSERQGKLLLIGLVGLMGLPVIGGAVGLWLKLQKPNAGFRWARR